MGGVGIGWPRLSPDGRQLLHGQLNVRSGDMDLWLLDLERDVGSRLTAQPGFSGWPVWSPDGRQVAYRYEQYSTAQFRVRSLDAGDAADLVLDERCNLRPTDWSPDGRWILVVGPSSPTPSDAIPPFPGGPRSGLDILAVPAQGGEPVPLKHSEFNESEARIAPDGRLFAYVSDVSGRPEIYVDWFVVGNGQARPPGGPWRVSPEGGDFPVWTRGGWELVYFGADDRFYSVNVDAAGDGVPQLGRPVPLPVPYGRRFFPPLSGVHYAVSADGQRFVLTPERGKVTEPMRVVVNWRRLLRGD
jgi:dipeptidyl aminopeptidase/acylaminoacyl peptidase